MAFKEGGGGDFGDSPGILRDSVSKNQSIFQRGREGRKRRKICSKALKAIQKMWIKNLKISKIFLKIRISGFSV